MFLCLHYEQMEYTVESWLFKIIWTQVILHNHERSSQIFVPKIERNNWDVCNNFIFQHNLLQVNTSGVSMTKGFDTFEKKISYCQPLIHCRHVEKKGTIVSNNKNNWNYLNQCKFQNIMKWNTMDWISNKMATLKSKYEIGKPRNKVGGQR